VAAFVACIVSVVTVPHSTPSGNVRLTRVGGLTRRRSTFGRRVRQIRSLVTRARSAMVSIGRSILFGGRHPPSLPILLVALVSRVLLDVALAALLAQVSGRAL
jgi:hypothetical protein